MIYYLHATKLRNINNTYKTTGIARHCRVVYTNVIRPDFLMGVFHCVVVSGKAAGIKSHRSRLSSARKSVRNTSVIYSQSRVSHQTEEINTIESSSRSTVSMTDRIHPLSDLALHEPGELIRLPSQKKQPKMEAKTTNKLPKSQRLIKHNRTNLRIII